MNRASQQAGGASSSAHLTMVSLLLIAWLGSVRSYGHLSPTPIGARATAGMKLSCSRVPEGVERSKEGLSVPYEDLSSLIQKVKREDAEWLQSVFGSSLDDLLPPTEDSGERGGAVIDNEQHDKDNTTNIDKKNDEKVYARDEEVEVEGEEEEEEDLSEWAEMLSLGYSKEDITSIKPSVRLVIIERSVQRPRKDLPRKWLLVAEDGQPPASSAAPKAAKSGSSGDKIRRSNTGVGSSVSWSGQPLSRDEKRAAERLREKSREISTSLRRSNNGPASSVYEGEDGPPSFWPDKKEFQDMLIDESNWRIDLIGDWCTPFIRAETKWRYGLYKNWLSFLDQGLGDGYDVVPDSFPSEVEEEAFESSRPARAAEAGVRERKSTPRRKASGGGSAARPQSRQAASYDRWVRNEVGSRDRGWTDLKEEERASTRALRDGRRTERFSRSVTPSAGWFEEEAEEEEERGLTDSDFDYEEEGEEEEEEEDFDRAWSDSLNRREAPLRGGSAPPRRSSFRDDSDDE